MRSLLSKIQPEIYPDLPISNAGSGYDIMLIKLLPSPTLNGDRPAFSNKLDSGHNKIILLRGKDHDPRGSSAAN